MQGYEELVY